MTETQNVQDSSGSTPELVMGDARLLARVEPLWQELRAHHLALCERWSATRSHVTFADRVEQMTAKAKQGMLVVLANTGSMDVGFGVFTVNESRCGEIESMFIQSPYRRFGLGSKIANTGLDWFDSLGLQQIEVSTHYKNPDAVRFYERLGFIPQTVRLERSASRSEVR